MTSKTSFKTKSTQGFISRNRLWLISLFTLISFLSYVVFFWFSVYDHGYQPDASDVGYARILAGQLRATVTFWLSYQSFSTIIACIYGFMLGVTSFNYLYKSKTVDFYFSMPKKKMAYFCEVCVNSVLIYTIVSAASYFVSTLIAKAVGAPVDGALLGVIVDGYVANFFLFLSIYAICIFAQTLCGHTFIAIMLAGYFLVIELAVRGTIGFLASVCFETDSLHGEYLLGKNIFPVITSPLYNIFTAAGASLYVKDALIAVVAFVLAFISYKHYRGEFAGKAVVYKGVRYLIKISLACMAAIWVAYFFLALSEQTLYTTTGKVFAGLGALLGAAIISGIAEIVFAFDIRAMFKRFWQMPIFAAAALVFVFSFGFDWYGYDSYVPEAKDVADCAIALSGGAQNQYIIKNGKITGSNATGYAEEYMHLSYTKEVQEVATVGMKKKSASKEAERYSAKGLIYEEDSYSPYNYDVTIMYRMKNGKTYRRNIIVPYDMDSSVLNSILGSDEYKQVSLTLNTTDELRKISEGYNCIEFCDAINKDVSDESIDEFFAAYQKDLKHWNYSVAAFEPILGEVYYSKNKMLSPEEMYEMYGYFETDSEENEQSVFNLGFPVYESFTCTIAYLEKNGLYNTYMINNPAVEDVAYIEIQKDDITSISGDSWQYGDGQPEQFFISDPEEMKEVLSAVEPAIGKTYPYHWHCTKDYDSRYTVYIYLYENTDGCYERCFLRGQVPEILSQYENTTY